ncbi:hypothetical protein [Absidia glauca]|uniref:Uncharacterized protein n=1 Tax=Absidia glauca TaxID=4829 RepID=A0A168RSE9_ABSGL|nr:hypothetical protein [Absidia glauca]
MDRNLIVNANKRKYAAMEITDDDDERLVEAAMDVRSKLRTNITAMRVMTTACNWEAWCQYHTPDISPWIEGIKRCSLHHPKIEDNGACVGPVTSSMYICDRQETYLIRTRTKGVAIPPGFMAEYIKKCLWLSTQGILSTKGSKKTIATFEDISIALTNTYHDQHRDPIYTIQTAAFGLSLLYTGVRSSSLVTPMHAMASDWKYLRWRVIISGYDTWLPLVLPRIAAGNRDLILYRNGSDAHGDRLFAKIEIQHMKGTAFVMNQANHVYIRTVGFPAAHGDVADLALTLMVLATLRGLSEVPVTEWVNGNLKIFSIKEQFLDMPVFCTTTGAG